MEHPPLDMLENKSFPPVAEAIRAAHDRIIERWQALVTQTLPQADELTLQQLHNSLPDILRQMAEAIESDCPQPTGRFLAISPSHGEMRYHQEFDLNELMIEYHLLRRAVLEQVVQHLGRPLELAEMIAISLGVDIAERQAAVAYAEYQARALRASTETQAKYLSFLSHDLRGGLNSILLMVEVLRRELAGSPQFDESVEDIDLMKRSILETVGTMDRFLHAEKLRKGGFRIETSPLNLEAFMTEMVQQFEPQAEQKGLELQRELVNATAAEPVVQTDRNLLSLIMQNLLSNAIKYSRVGAVQFRCRVSSDTDARHCRFSIHDQGPGIEASKLDELFEPFSRGETHGESGSGLGLSIVQQAAELLGAKIRVESEVGKGSTFHVEVPEKKASQEEESEVRNQNSDSDS